MFGVFTFLLFISAISMIYETNKNVKPISIKNFYALIIIEGFVVGGLTGFVGAGGGFLIIPALVILIGLDIKKAIATSLIIIALKSTFGFFLGDVMVMNIDWDFLIYFTIWTTLGVIIGTYFGKSIDKLKLKKWFGIFIMVIAISILFKEFII